MINTNLVSEISLEFTTDDNFDTHINRILRILGTYLDVSRCYLFLNSEDGRTTSNTHEWCAIGIETQKDNLQEIPYSEIPTWTRILQKDIFISEYISKMPEDVRKILESQNIKSIIVCPIKIKNKIHGFLGVDECSRNRVWTEEEIKSLKTITEIISVAYLRKLLDDGIKTSEENFKNFFDSIDDIIIIGDKDGWIVYANEVAVQKLGYSREQLVKKHILEVHPENKRKEAGNILEKMFSGELKKCPLELISEKGELIPVETRIWFGKWNGEECIFRLSRDLSVQQAALQKFERIFKDNPAPMALSNGKDGSFIDVNDAWLSIMGYTSQEILGKTSEELNLFQDFSKFKLIKEELLKNNKISNKELTINTKEGKTIHGLFWGELIKSQGETFLLTLMIDITEKKLLEQKIQELIIKDPLTEIHNRLYVFEKLENFAEDFIKFKKNFYIYIIDIDNFKQINDTLGHQAGDFILKEFATLLNKSVKSKDLLGRYGGEEFIIVTKNTTEAGAVSLIRRVLEKINNHVFNYNDKKIILTVSCGMANSRELSEDNFSIAALISLADERMYKIKKNGKNGFMNAGTDIDEGVCCEDN